MLDFIPVSIKKKEQMPYKRVRDYKGLHLVTAMLTKQIVLKLNHIIKYLCTHVCVWDKVFTTAVGIKSRYVTIQGLGYLTLSWGVVKFCCTTLAIFNFTHWKYISKASIICDI